MATITTRSSKGAALTHTEMDANFTNLNTDKIETSKFANVTGNVTSSDTELNILDGATVTTAEVNYLDLTTGPGTQEASKAVVADANVNTGISKVTELHIGASGSETQVTATATELNTMDGITATVTELNKLDGATASTTELNYVTGVTSSIQTQLNNTNTTSNILSLTASASVGAVGTYAFLAYNVAASVAAGATLAGSSLYYSNTVNYLGAQPSGTWRAMGQLDATDATPRATLWLRIS